MTGKRERVRLERVRDVLFALEEGQGDNLSATLADWWGISQRRVNQILNDHVRKSRREPNTCYFYKYRSSRVLRSPETQRTTRAVNPKRSAVYWKTTHYGEQWITDNASFYRGGKRLPVGEEGFVSVPPRNLPPKPSTKADFRLEGFRVLYPILEWPEDLAAVVHGWQSRQLKNWGIGWELDPATEPFKVWITPKSVIVTHEAIQAQDTFRMWVQACNVASEQAKKLEIKGFRLGIGEIGSRLNWERRTPGTREWVREQGPQGYLEVSSPDGTRLTFDASGWPEGEVGSNDLDFVQELFRLPRKVQALTEAALAQHESIAELNKLTAERLAELSVLVGALAKRSK